ncbi:MAG TPA: energy transducer TonB [Nitrospiria bacterium]|nr:energy transducer TonB [Nitrospiria bacterium]
MKESSLIRFYISSMIAHGLVGMALIFIALPGSKLRDAKVLMVTLVEMSDVSGEGQKGINSLDVFQSLPEAPSTQEKAAMRRNPPETSDHAPQESPPEQATDPDQPKTKTEAALAYQDIIPKKEIEMSNLKPTGKDTVKNEWGGGSTEDSHESDERHVNGGEYIQGDNGSGQASHVPDGGAERLKLYLEEIKARLNKAKRYPWLARLQGLEGTTQIRFRIMPDGEAAEIEVVKSSRSELLDQEAVANVKRVKGFPRPPEEFPQGILVQVPMVFQLKGGQDMRD